MAGRGPRRGGGERGIRHRPHAPGRDRAGRPRAGARARPARARDRRAPRARGAGDRATRNRPRLRRDADLREDRGLSQDDPRRQGRPRQAGRSARRARVPRAGQAGGEPGGRLRHQGAHRAARAARGAGGRALAGRGGRDEGQGDPRAVPGAPSLRAHHRARRRRDHGPLRRPGRAHSPGDLAGERHADSRHRHPRAGARLRLRAAGPHPLRQERRPGGGERDAVPAANLRGHDHPPPRGARARHAHDADRGGPSEHRHGAAPRHVRDAAPARRGAGRRPGPGRRARLPRGQGLRAGRAQRPAPPRRGHARLRRRPRGRSALRHRRRRRDRAQCGAGRRGGRPRAAGAGGARDARGAARLMRRRLAAALTAALLAGCAPTQEPRGILARLWHLELGPAYRRPAVVTPADFRSRLGPGEAASFADLPWWRVFDDPVLAQLVGEALAHNFDLEAAVARVEEARARVGIAAAPLYPQAGYEGEAARQKTFFPIGGGGNVTFDAFAGFFDVAWELDVWGRIRRATEAARADFLATEEARRGVVLTLVSDVAAAYFRLLELDREREIARESTAAYRETRDLFLERYRHGTDTKISVARAEAAPDASRAGLVALEREIAPQENAISTLLGANPRPIPRGRPLDAQTIPSTPPGLTTAVLERRPDIREAEQEMIAANALVGEAIARFFPTIGLAALYGGEGNRIGDVV